MEDTFPLKRHFALGKEDFKSQHSSLQQFFLLLRISCTDGHDLCHGASYEALHSSPQMLHDTIILHPGWRIQRCVLHATGVLLLWWYFSPAGCSACSSPSPVAANHADKEATQGFLSWDGWTQIGGRCEEVRELDWDQFHSQHFWIGQTGCAPGNFTTKSFPGYLKKEAAIYSRIPKALVARQSLDRFS